ncbi:MAG TPA: hypothetical protein H9875_04090 [Candidatus Levilactobacillus faecigallinarum]|uniref:Uncharacterized protein n=1 Tax=Candidatus Levilactobacillus faecigallinarum TaxID=2838638 RepID=A0A9D1U5V2_9LACO|nr:hypothetical protein [Candidatus Levilactobacillus faecigallinarum]
MGKLKLIGFMSVLSLGLGVQSAQASTIPAATSPYWWSYRQVTVRRGTWAHHIKSVFPACNNYVDQKKYLKPGTKLRVRNGGASWHWVVTGAGLQNGRNFWVVNRSSTTWFRQR